MTKINLRQLRSLIKEELDPRLLSTRLLSLAGSIHIGNVEMEERLSAIEKSISTLANASDPKVSQLVHETVVALSGVRESLRALSAVAKKAKDLSPHK